MPCSRTQCNLPQVRFVPVTARSRVKHSTTDHPLYSLKTIEQFVGGDPMNRQSAAKPIYNVVILHRQFGYRHLYWCLGNFLIMFIFFI